MHSSEEKYLAIFLDCQKTKNGSLQLIWIFAMLKPLKIWYFMNKSSKMIIVRKEDYEHKSYILYELYQLFSSTCADFDFKCTTNMLKSIFKRSFFDKKDKITVSLRDDGLFYSSCTLTNQQEIL